VSEPTRQAVDCANVRDAHSSVIAESRVSSFTLRNFTAKGGLRSGFEAEWRVARQSVESMLLSCGHFEARDRDPVAKGLRLSNSTKSVAHESKDGPARRK
jgi:hypothetical protein